MLYLCLVVVESFKLSHSNTDIKMYLDFLKLVTLLPRRTNVFNLVFLLLVLTDREKELQETGFRKVLQIT